MALSNLSLLDLTTTNTTASTITSGTVSPTANALVICGSAYRGGTQRTAQTPSTTATGMGTITLIINEAGDNSGGTKVGAGSWYSQATASPSSGTFTATWGGTSNQQMIWVMQCTGHDTSSPIGSSNSTALDGSGGTNIATTITTPATDSMIVATAIVASTASGLSATDGCTELIDANVTTTFPLLYVQYKNGTPPSTVTRTNLTSNTIRSQIMFEIKVAPTPPPFVGGPLVFFIGY